LAEATTAWRSGGFSTGDLGVSFGVNFGVDLESYTYLGGYDPAEMGPIALQE
jgi:hypothetical protein